MLEKPDLADEKIIACARDTYGLAITDIEFLPIGYDSYAAVYRAPAADGQRYFLKLKYDAVYEPSITIPRYLKDLGIEQVVAPLPTITQTFWGNIGDYRLIVYPYVEGSVGMEVGLSDSQWTAFGAFLKQLHTAQLTPDLLAQVRTEDFVPNRHWSGIVRRLHAEVRQRDYDDPYAKELAAFWRERHAQIGKLVERAEALGRLLQTRSLPFVLCHADIHTANLLLTPDGKLFVVDWDQPIMAPKERDLMFVIGATVGGFLVGAREEDLFLQGYGQCEVDWLALAYYRYEWVVQDMGGFGEQVLLMDGAGEETRQDSMQRFMGLFAPGDVVEVAYASEHRLPPELQQR